LKRRDFRDDLKEENVFDDLTLQGSDRWCSIRKRPLTMRVHGYRRKTKNGSIKKRLLLVDWFVNFEFSQVVRNGRAEAVIAQRSEFVLYSCINGQPVERSKIISGEI